MKDISVLTVTQLNFYIKSLIDADDRLQMVFVVGEVSNFVKNQHSGHVYFSIKDKHSVIRAVMFSWSAKRLKFNVSDGMKVIVRGRISLYEPSGAYQIYIEDLQPDGLGTFNLQFEQLKEKLMAQGLFDNSRKKNLPPYPNRVGVITSQSGAVFSDIVSVMARRYPLAEVVLYPAAVQGEEAISQIMSGIKEFNARVDVDVLIIARGGGSAEDLWAFNDELLALAVADSRIPIISAVGHETDFTICDFVADLRAPTPSAAAELAVPDINELKARINGVLSSIDGLILSQYHSVRENLSKLTHSHAMSNPMGLVENKKLMLSVLSGELNINFSRLISVRRETFLSLTAKLDVLSPLRLLSSGYAIVVNDKSGRVINGVKRAKKNDKIKVRFADGSLDCTVNDRRTMDI